MSSRLATLATLLSIGALAATGCEAERVENPTTSPRAVVSAPPASEAPNAGETRPRDVAPSGADEHARRRRYGRAVRGIGAMEDELGAELGVSLEPVGEQLPPVRGGSLRAGSAWSTIKVPIALRVLEEAGGPSGLSPRQSADIGAAITASDNAAAARLFDDLVRSHGGVDGAAAAVEAVLARAGDRRTEVSTVGRDGFSPYGQTEWALDAQVELMDALASGCVGDRGSRRTLLEAMSRVTADRWGLGAVEMPALWKGGWGPDPAGKYLVRQMGVVDLGDHRVAIAIAARPSDGSFASGTAAASELASRVVRSLGELELPARSGPAGDSCAAGADVPEHRSRHLNDQGSR